MSFIISPGTRPSIGTGLRQATESLWSRVKGLVSLVFAVAAERHHLAGLDDHLLRDAGIGRAAAAREAGRDLLDLPQSRLPST